MPCYFLLSVKRNYRKNHWRKNVANYPKRVTIFTTNFWKLIPIYDSWGLNLRSALMSKWLKWTNLQKYGHWALASSNCPNTHKTGIIRASEALDTWLRHHLIRNEEWMTLDYFHDVWVNDLGYFGPVPSNSFNGLILWAPFPEVCTNATNTLKQV